MHPTQETIAPSKVSFSTTPPVGANDELVGLIKGILTDRYPVTGFDSLVEITSDIDTQRQIVIEAGRLFRQHSQNESVAFPYFKAWRDADRRLLEMEAKNL